MGELYVYGVKSGINGKLKGFKLLKTVNSVSKATNKIHEFKESPNSWYDSYFFVSEKLEAKSGSSNVII